MLLRAKTRPGHSRAPKPNACIGKSGTFWIEPIGLGEDIRVVQHSPRRHRYDRSDDAHEWEGAYHTFGIIVEPAGMK